MQVETVNVPGIGVFTHICDFCLAGPIFPITYSGKAGKEYCTENCRDRGEAMKHSDFGGADVKVPLCDHCRGPLKIVALKGRYGRYCKQACFVAAESGLTEKEKTEMARKNTAADKKTAKRTTKTTTKKTAAKKATRAAKQASGDSATAAVRAKLETGKPVALADLKGICESAGKSSSQQIIYYLLKRMEKEGFKVKRDKEAGTVQVAK